MKRIFPLILLVFSLTTGVFAQDRAAAELARRLLGPWGDPGGMTTEVTPGELPRTIPDDFALPAEFRLVGSLANYNADGSLSHSQVVLDSPLLPGESLDALRAALGRQGFTLQPQGEMTGFQPAIPQVYATFCAADEGFFIHVSAFPLADGTGASGHAITDIRLEINGSVFYTPCGDNAYPVEEPPYAPLPALHSPMGSEITLHGGNFLPDEGSTSAVIRTDIPADELLRHFEVQLEREGWQRASSASAGASAWTRVHRERNWHGTLTITRLADSPPSYYAAFISIAAAD